MSIVISSTRHRSSPSLSPNFPLNSTAHFAVPFELTPARWHPHQSSETTYNYYDLSLSLSLSLARLLSIIPKAI